MSNALTDTSLSRVGIIERAKDKWNSRSSSERLKCSNKYHHILVKIGAQPKPWDEEFSKLSFRQKNILIKGELIRTYDSLSNQEKTKIKEKLGLSTFSSKWFKLPPSDKRKLLLEILQ